MNIFGIVGNVKRSGKVTKREFIKRVNQAKKFLRYGKQWGCCWCLEKSGIDPEYFDLCAPYTLKGLEKIGFDDQRAYWLGYFDYIGLERRLYWLDFFREMMIATKYYKEL